jgi:hypothetical protein
MGSLRSLLKREDEFLIDALKLYKIPQTIQTKKYKRAIAGMTKIIVDRCCQEKIEYKILIYGGAECPSIIRLLRANLILNGIASQIENLEGNPNLFIKFWRDLSWWDSVYGIVERHEGSKKSSFERDLETFDGTTIELNGLTD